MEISPGLRVQNLLWLVHTTFGFYNLGVLRTDKLLYKDDLIVTRFYERLFSLDHISKQPDSR